MCGKERNYNRIRLENRFYFLKYPDFAEIFEEKDFCENHKCFGSQGNKARIVQK